MKSIGSIKNWPCMAIEALDCMGGVRGIIQMIIICGSDVKLQAKGE